MAKTDNSYRIRTNIGDNTVINVPLHRDVDFLEILTLKISQKGLYKLHASNYGVIVGRVLANDGFGIPNARLSVFVELSQEDRARTDITQYYPYTSISSTDGANRRYNLLPDSKNNDCYRIVGTFPSKRMVLDNNTEIEIFDKYWKYTTVTNASGDYMIFGVPTGSQNLHVDIDLSNIGILSQKPRDMFFKGYNITSFDNANQFKESTNLDNLVQIIGQNQSVTVYPFWGDENAEGNISITRADINIAYKFETTCVFMGSIASDDQSNSLGHECTPTKKMGYNGSLTASEGTIEMIRKTPDGLVEETQIQGNQLIDGDGIWCYQIPMNLDYVITDEFGNLVPTDNPNKGIPTRASVRFRISVNETGSEGISRHRAEYLVPNNPMPSNFKSVSSIKGINAKIDNYESLVKNYEFGSATPDECFRNIYWNKVYSVKNYIPRLQSNKSTTTDQYSGVRTINYHNTVSPFPFNNVRFKFPFSYIFLCILMEIFFVVVALINAILSIFRIICIGIPGLKIFGIKLYWYPFDFIQCITMTIEDDEAGDGSMITYAPGCWGRPPKGAKIGDMGGYSNRMQRGLAQDAEVVNFDFYNDWINGCLYMPLWFWKKTKKKKYFFGLFSKAAVNKFCDTARTTKNLRIAQGCPVSVISDSDSGVQSRKNVHRSLDYLRLPYGVIHEKTNKDGLKVYYYAPVTTTTTNTKQNNLPFVRLFATDLILLGSLADCDTDGIPPMFKYLPSTTANIPFMVSTKIYTDDSVSSEITETTPLSVTGMDWGSSEGRAPKKLAKGLLLDLSCTSAKTYHKSIINTRRLCELGVTLDGAYDKVTPGTGGVLQYREIEPDGLVTRIELDDLESRAMFATLNHNGLDKLTFNPVTKYTTYKLDYLYPTEFDGAMNSIAKTYTSNNTLDESSESYLKYRFGIDANTRMCLTNMFPLYNNSFFFYFGITPGKTAIEKFYTNFYADCFENSKEPFAWDVTATPGSWCDQDASAVIDVSKIRAPYSLQVVDSMGMPFIDIDGLTHTKIHLDYWADSEYDDKLDKKGLWNTAEKFNFSEYEIQTVLGGTKDDNNDIIASFEGIVYKEMGVDGDEPYYQILSTNLTNGMYTVKITDAYNGTISGDLNLLQSTLNIEINSRDLSTKYKIGEFVNEKSSGKIIINSYSIDGKTYRFDRNDRNQCKRIDDGVFEIYGRKVTMDGDGNAHLSTTPNIDNKIRITITPQNQLGDPAVLSFDDSVFNGNGEWEEYAKMNTSESSFGSVFDLQTKSLFFKTKTADEFSIYAVMYCGNDVSDNTFETSANIESGDELRLLLENIDTAIVKPTYSNEESIKRWTTICDENNFQFPACTVANQEWWSLFLDGTPIFDGNWKTEDGGAEKITAYKLDCILQFANSSSCASSQNTLAFSTKGGSDPVLYLAYPEYTAITTANHRGAKLNKYPYSDTATTIQVENNYPTVINSNYYTYPYDIKTTYNWRYALNSIFKTTNLNNYAGVIDANNDELKKPLGIKKFGSIEVRSNMEGSDTQNYFSIQAVDRRTDYDLHILKNTNTNSILVDSKFTRFYNGIAFLYDKNHRLVSTRPSGSTDSYVSDTEYSYIEGDENSLKHHYNRNRRYYDLDFRSDIDIMGKTSNTGRTTAIDASDLSEAEESTYEFPIFKLNADWEYNRGLSFSWEHTSCTYNTDAGFVQTTEEYVTDASGTTIPQNILSGYTGATITKTRTINNVDCEAYDGEVTDGVIGTSNYFRMPYITITDIAKNNMYNVLYNQKKTSLKELNIAYGIIYDNVTAHSVYTNAPILLGAQGKDAVPPTVQDINEGYNRKLVRNTKLIILPDYTETYAQCNDSSQKNKYVAEKGKEDYRLADDEDLRNAVYYKLSVNRRNIPEIGYPVVKREYVDNSFSSSRLARRVFTYEIGKRFLQEEIIGDKRLIIEVACGGRITWNDYLPLDDSHTEPMPIAEPGSGSKKENKKACFLLISFSGYIDDTHFSNNWKDLIASDEDGRPIIAVKMVNDIYTEAFPLKDGKLLVPFYSESAQGGEDVPDEGDDSEDTNDDSRKSVTPLWYKKGKKLYVYVKYKKNDLIYTYWRKLLK